MVYKYARLLLLYWRFARARRRVERDPAKHDYMDLALTPAEEHDLDELDMFTATEFGQATVEKIRKQRAIRSPHLVTGEKAAW